MLKKHGKRTLVFMLSMVLLLNVLAAGLAALAATNSYQYDVTYYQSDARSLLSRVNTLRRGSNAWYWNSSNTEKIVVSGLLPLKYDYDLEKIAMQRAAELVAYYAHKRPGGEEWDTLYPDRGTAGYAAGENVGHGYAMTSEAVMASWEESNQYYAGQGHRRIMLNRNFSAIGIACAEYNGERFWVQEFHGTTMNTTSTTANNQLTTVTVSIQDSLIDNKAYAVHPESLDLDFAQSVSLPKVSCDLSMNVSPNMLIMTNLPKADWTSSNTSVAVISGDTVVGVGAGSATLSTTVNGKRFTVPVTVDEGPENVVNVTFNPNGGTCSIQALLVSVGTTYGELPTPTRSGYKFLGWFTAASGGTQVTANTRVTNTNNHTLYAHWEKTAVTYKLTYNANGGSGAPAAQTGSAVYTISSATPSRSGYTFLGWATSASAATVAYKPGDSISLTRDTTLYAVWKANETNSFTVTPTNVSFQAGESATLTIAYSGYTDHPHLQVHVYLKNSTILSYTFGEWQNHTNTLTLSANKAGSETIRFVLLDADTNAELESRSVSVTVTAKPADPDPDPGSGSFLDRIASIFPLLATLIRWIKSLFD